MRLLRLQAPAVSLTPMKARQQHVLICDEVVESPPTPAAAPVGSSCRPRPRRQAATPACSHCSATPSRPRRGRGAHRQRPIPSGDVAGPRLLPSARKPELSVPWSGVAARCGRPDCAGKQRRAPRYLPAQARSDLDPRSRHFLAVVAGCIPNGAVISKDLSRARGPSGTGAGATFGPAAPPSRPKARRRSAPGCDGDERSGPSPGVFVESDKRHTTPAGQSPVAPHADVGSIRSISATIGTRRTLRRLWRRGPVRRHAGAATRRRRRPSRTAPSG
jgi:hypothetical protein